MVLSVSGSLHSCGRGSHGQLGHQDDILYCYLKLVDFFVDSRILAASAGSRHSLVLCEHGASVFSFGESALGKLGTGRTGLLSWYNEHPTDLNMQLLHGVYIRYICAGPKNSFAITEDGDLYVWGQYQGDLWASPHLLHEPNLRCC